MAYFSFYASFYEFFARLGLSFKAIWRYFPNRIYLLFILLFQIGGWLQAILINNSLSSELLVLRYKIDFGANLIGEPSLIFIFPLISAGVFVFNFSLLLFWRKKNNFHFLSQLVLSGALVFSFFLSLYLFSVYLINFR